MFTTYTPIGANKALPEVKRRFNSIVYQKNNIVALQEELQRITESNSSIKRFIIKKQELNSAVSNLYRSIEKLEDLGVVIKSVDDGLLDFPSMRFDEEVWLCWKAGETGVKFWHGKDEGFMARKPLEKEGFPGHKILNKGGKDWREDMK
jgi:hypothetical protein